MGYVVDTIVEEKSATLRFVGDSPYRSEEDRRLVEVTGRQLQETTRASARASGKLGWFKLLTCGILRRHIFVDFKIESTGGHFVICARCFKVSRTYVEETSST